MKENGGKLAATGFLCFGCAAAAFVTGDGFLFLAALALGYAVFEMAKAGWGKDLKREPGQECSDQKIK